MLTIEGQVCELRGMSNSGKTQTALWLTARLLIAGHSIVYIDAANSACVDRLTSILISLNLPQEEWVPMLQRLQVVSVYEREELMKTLKYLIEEPTFQRCRLLILDSLEGTTSADMFEYRNSLQHERSFLIVKNLLLSINQMLSIHFQARNSFSVLVCAGDYRLHGKQWTNRADQRFRLIRTTSDRFVFIQQNLFEPSRRFDVMIGEGGLRCIQPNPSDQQNIDN